MTALDDKLVPRAAKIIAAKGKSITYKWIEQIVYDVTKGECTTPETIITTKGIFAKAAGRRLENEEASNERLIYIAAEPLGDLIPKHGDFVTFDGREWVVENVPEGYYTGEKAALWALLVRS